MNEWIEILGNVGFPIAITLWFMFRMEKIIKENTNATNELRLEIHNINYRRKK